MGHPLEYGGVHAAALLITEYSYLEAPGIVWHFNAHAVVFWDFVLSDAQLMIPLVTTTDLNRLILINFNCLIDGSYSNQWYQLSELPQLSD